MGEGAEEGGGGDEWLEDGLRVSNMNRSQRGMRGGKRFGDAWFRMAELVGGECGFKGRIGASVGRDEWTRESRRLSVLCYA